MKLINIFNIQPDFIKCIGSIDEKPVVINGQITITPVLHISMCYNHGVLDGPTAYNIPSEIKHRIKAGDYYFE